MYKYRTISKIDDYGVKVAKIICFLPFAVTMDMVRPSQFNVFTAKLDQNDYPIEQTDFHTGKKYLAMGYRTVLSAYVSDQDGNPVGEGSCVTLELDMKDRDAIKFAMIDNMPDMEKPSARGRNEFVKNYYRVTQVEPIGRISGMIFDISTGDICPQTVGWTNVVDPEGISYGYYTPENRDNRPLIIWLHGYCEGGTDPRISYMTQNVPNLSSKEVQAIFGGAYVLSPQARTFWMDDGNGQYQWNGESMYTSQLKSLIDNFVETHKIDKSRIYIGGCSNGGFMTMRMLIDYPAFFAAAFPICQAFYDRNIKDEQIRKLAKEHIWFVHAASDGMVSPKETSTATYRRLRYQDAKDVHYHYFYDLPPYHTIGHATWIPTLNGDVHLDYQGYEVKINGKPVDLFEWMAHQSIEQ